TVKVRVWADAAVRARPRWRDDIADQIDYASQLLTPLLGVRMAIDGVKEWDRTGDLHAAIAALAEADKGQGVTWVIGYVASGDATTQVMSELGDAAVLGRYITIRDWAEKPETDVLAAVVPDLSQAQRIELV